MNRIRLLDTEMPRHVSISLGGQVKETVADHIEKLGGVAISVQLKEEK